MDEADESIEINMLTDLENHVCGLTSGNLARDRPRRTGEVSRLLCVLLPGLLLPFVEAAHGEEGEYSRLRNAANQVANSIFAVVRSDGRYGTAILFSKQDRYVLTCAHVADELRGREGVVAVHVKSSASFVVDAIITHQDYPKLGNQNNDYDLPDLALLHLSGTGPLPDPPDFARSPAEIFAHGTNIAQVGLQLGSDDLLKSAIKYGVILEDRQIQDLRPEGRRNPVILTDIVSFPGESGSAIVTSNGVVVGVHTANYVLSPNFTARHSFKSTGIRTSVWWDQNRKN